ncbi:hypothetical protein ACFY0F_28225 [Streptomyces sp. NPDC001544]|uniref:hypothetical protein n=1 Tax=Streptomyces sp. NPDC001544 TaxID=3364584 RepID=UPI00369213DB
MTIRRRLAPLAATTALAISGLTALTPAAHAAPAGAEGVDSHVYTPDRCGEARWISSGDKFGVRDDCADGYRAVAYVYWSGSDGTPYSAEVQDANGAGSTWEYNNNHNMPEGAVIELWVCLRNGANGADFRCNFDTSGVA